MKPLLEEQGELEYTQTQKVWLISHATIAVSACLWLSIFQPSTNSQETLQGIGSIIRVSQLLILLPFLAITIHGRLRGAFLNSVFWPFVLIFPFLTIFTLNLLFEGSQLTLAFSLLSFWLLSVCLPKGGVEYPKHIPLLILCIAIYSWIFRHSLMLLELPLAVMLLHLGALLNSRDEFKSFGFVRVMWLLAGCFILLSNWTIRQTLFGEYFLVALFGIFGTIERFVLVFSVPVYSGEMLGHTGRISHNSILNEFRDIQLYSSIVALPVGVLLGGFLLTLRNLRIWGVVLILIFLLLPLIALPQVANSFLIPGDIPNIDSRRYWGTAQSPGLSPTPLQPFYCIPVIVSLILVSFYALKQRIFPESTNVSRLIVLVFILFSFISLNLNAIIFACYSLKSDGYSRGKTEVRKANSQEAEAAIQALVNVAYSSAQRNRSDNVNTLRWNGAGQVFIDEISDEVIEVLDGEIEKNRQLFSGLPENTRIYSLRKYTDERYPTEWLFKSRLTNPFQVKATHLIAKNDFVGAAKYISEAFEFDYRLAQLFSGDEAIPNYGIISTSNSLLSYYIVQLKNESQPLEQIEAFYRSLPDLSKFENPPSLYMKGPQRPNWIVLLESDRENDNYEAHWNATYPDYLLQRDTLRFVYFLQHNRRPPKDSEELLEFTRSFGKSTIHPMTATVMTDLLTAISNPSGRGFEIMRKGPQTPFRINLYDGSPLLWYPEEVSPAEDEVDDEE